MFTGIVEEIGEVAELNPHDATGGTSLTIALPAGSTLLDDCHEGDSIAVNGTCLTVTSFETAAAAAVSAAAAADAAGSGKRASSFTVGVAPETLRLTNLGALAAGGRVNLERAVRADTRMGGHFVQGHVDTVATIAARRPDGNAVTVRFAPRDRAVLRHVVYKGFIALDGTSLTVTAVDDDEGWWEVMLIAYTQERVVLAGKHVGDTVNVEVDMTAKYVEKSLQGYLVGLSEDGGGVLGKMVERIVAQGFGSSS